MTSPKGPVGTRTRALEIDDLGETLILFTVPISSLDFSHHTDPQTV